MSRTTDPMALIPPLPPSGPPDDEEREAREFEARQARRDPAEVAATDWHNRRSEGLAPAEEAEFRQWLAADPAHAAAFSHLERCLHALRRLPPERIARLRSGGAPAHSPTRSFTPPARLARLLRPALLAASCALLLAVSLGWRQWQRQPVFTGAYATQRGQMRTARLPDGSELALDAATRADVLLYRDRREVRLSDGQALFSVAPDPARPFHVLAGPARVTVTGTRFSVRYRGAGAVEVAVETGAVAVGAADARGPGATLIAGQGIRIGPAGDAGEVTPVPSGDVAPWRRGLIHFSDTPLAEALRELERYGPTRLIVRDGEVAALPIGGSYEIGRPDRFARLLPRILPVKLVPSGDGAMEIVRAR